MVHECNDCGCELDICDKCQKILCENCYLNGKGKCKECKRSNALSN